MAQRASKSGDGTKGSELACPECGRMFGRPAALGAHRSRTHGVAGTTRNAASGRRQDTAGRVASDGRTRRGVDAGGGPVDRDALLQTLFPNGLPARASTLAAVAAWLDEAERLARPS